MPAFEVRIPILPQPSFYSNVKLAALSLAKLGEPYASAPVVVSVADHADVDRVQSDNAWSRDFPVIWRAVPHHVCDLDPRGFSSGVDRYEEPPRADIIILCDADACLIARTDELFERLRTSRPMAAGLMAHASPFGRDKESNDAGWRQMLDAAGLSDQALRYRYSVAPEQAGRCPAYFNYGFVAFNRSAFELVRPLVRPYTDLARARLENTKKLFFAGQIGFALALAAAGFEILELGPEYNCPSSDEMLGRGIDDPAQIRVLHFLRKDEFDRHDFLVDPAAFQRFSTVAFSSRVNRHFQRHVLSLPDVFYSRPTQGSQA